MIMSRRTTGGLVACLVAGWLAAVVAQAPPPVEYRLSFPVPEHRWLAVDVLFPEIGDAPLDIRMSSASPGRYARHEFAKNVIEVRFTNGVGGDVAVTQRGPAQWAVARHDGAVRARYRLFGDRVDGTYLAVDSSHAHMNMPATLMWAAGLEDRAATVTFEMPPARRWQAATQLFPTADPFVFRAPNLQYLLDSPTELSDFDLRTFTVRDPADNAYVPTFRLAVHHDGATSALAPFARAVERIVRETVTVFGEFPRFETGTYTFIADYLPYASGDAMEHRNSAVLTSAGRLDGAADRARLLGAVAHEFFHAWNVERIRPRSLEPFDFTGANVSGELWLAEGVTNYYGALVMHRAGLTLLPATLSRFANAINTVTLGPGRQFRSVVDMSRMAPFTDAATAIDRTNLENTFISYYVWGEALGLGLDLALRTRADGAVTLDDYMRALWERFGRPGGAAAGAVDRPYTPDDAERLLGVVAGDPAFAGDFFARYINGREVVDYAGLLAHAGFVVQPAAPGRATLGDLSLGAGMRVIEPTAYASPLHEAGIERDDVLATLDGHRLTSGAQIDRLVSAKSPGDVVTIEFVRRGQRNAASATLDADGRIEIVPVESTGTALTERQRAFRDAWLGSRQD